MRAIFGLVLIIGVALAGGAVMMAKNYIQAHQAALAAERAKGRHNIETVNVAVAKTQLSYGQKLSREDVAMIPWPKVALPEGAFTDIDTLFVSDDAGDARYVLRTIEKSEALMAVKITKPGEDAGITSRLERGMRAFAIRVDVASGVSGFLRPGDHVDIYWTGQFIGDGNRRKGEITRLIQSGIELIAVDQIAGKDVNKTVIARTVTVKATPEQIAILAQGQSTGSLTLSLVGAQDDSIASIADVDQRTLLGLADIEPAAPVEKKRVCKIKTRRGADVVYIPIPCSD